MENIIAVFRSEKLFGIPRRQEVMLNWPVGISACEQYYRLVSGRASLAANPHRVELARDRYQLTMICH